MDSFDSEALPQYRAWRRAFQPPPDARAYLAEHLDLAAATFFSELLVPDFILVDGCVLLEAQYSPATFAEWWVHECGDTASVERALNRLHLWDIFEPFGDVENLALDVLARRLARSWAAHASIRFPSRIFNVEVTDDYGPTVVMSSRTS